MKTKLITLFLLLLSCTVFSQKAMYEYTGRNTPLVKKEKLKEIKSINDLTPELWQKMILANHEREELERRRKMAYSVGCYLYPQGGYTSVVEYVSVEISTAYNGKTITVESSGDQLSAKQKSMLSVADAGAPVNIKIKFRYKNFVDENLEVDREIKTGYLTLSVVPETEAEYPGGFKQLTDYLTYSVFSKLSKESAAHKIGDAVVSFTVNEQGQVVNVRILRTSGDYDTDRIVLDAVSKMPAWKPAKNSKGINVKEEFNIPFGGM
jgi:TonB family protein